MTYLLSEFVQFQPQTVELIKTFYIKELSIRNLSCRQISNYLFLKLLVVVTVRQSQVFPEHLLGIHCLLAIDKNVSYFNSFHNKVEFVR